MWKKKSLTYYLRKYFLCLSVLMETLFSGIFYFFAVRSNGSWRQGHNFPSDTRSPVSCYDLIIIIF